MTETFTFTYRDRYEVEATVDDLRGTLYIDSVRAVDSEEQAECRAEMDAIKEAAWEEFADA